MELEDLAALIKLLDFQIKDSACNSEDDQLEAFVYFLESKYAKQKAFIRSLDCNAHVGLEEGKMGSALIPEDLPVDDKETYKGVRTTGNGHCLYNAVSLTLVGDESYATLLRLLVALELVINVNFYAQHPKFTFFFPLVVVIQTPFFLFVYQQVATVFVTTPNKM